MIKTIKIKKYRKLKNLELSFSKGLTAISGTNGTCKTSILHLFSNSFQSVKANAKWLNDSNVMLVINAINALTNPKIETLTRGDKVYNDPANGIKGDLYSVEYFQENELSFRKHNSAINSRYAIKPKYSKGSRERLPYCPVIYLGLTRLVPYGEYQDDSMIKVINRKLSPEYQAILANLYKSFTNYSIEYRSQQKMGPIKKRLDFVSNCDGVDSNTISAGEDNLSIILTALVSLRYYFESVTSDNVVESILLIDEIDATLHPTYQIKLLKIFMEYSEKYKIQIIFTTHSLSLLEKMLEYKKNVIYLIDNFTSVVVMEEPDIYKINMHLQSLTENDIYMDKVIPIFTEDAEARFLLKSLFSYFQQCKHEFSSIGGYFHIVDANIGSNNLKNIFEDSKLLRSTIKSICILDGDSTENLDNHIIKLPGNVSPEELLLKYASKLYNDDDEFWVARTILDRNLGKSYYVEHIESKCTDFQIMLAKCKEQGKSTKGMVRGFNKTLFNENINFFELLFKHWLNNKENEVEIQKFYTNLQKMFMKVCRYNDISPNVWK